MAVRNILYTAVYLAGEAKIVRFGYWMSSNNE